MRYLPLRGWMPLLVCLAAVPAAGPLLAAGALFPDEVLPLGPEPWGLSARDVNADGILDLISANGPEGDGSVSVLLGRGDGSFQPAQGYQAGARPWGLDAGDLNGDGRADIAVGDFHGGVTLLMGAAGAGFVPGPALDGVSTSAVRIRDVNADGRPDLLSLDAGTIKVSLGQPDGTLSPPVETATGLTLSLAVGDMDGDLFPDVAVSDVDGSTVMKGLGDGLFVPLGQFEGATDVELADLNADGRDDLAAIDLDGNLRVRLTMGDGTPGAALTMSASVDSYALAVGDFSGDGVPDLATAGRGEILVLRGVGQGGFVLAGRRSELTSGFTLVNGDFDGDGLEDLATDSASGPAELLALFGRPDGRVGPRARLIRTPFDEDGYGFAFGDLNEDGIEDLIVALESAAVASPAGLGLYLGDGQGGAVAVAPIPVESDPVLPIVRDLNGDGHLDIVVQSSVALTCDFSLCLAVAPADLRTYLGRGDGSFELRSVFDVRPLDQSAHSGPAVVADLDGDGRDDIAHSASDGVWISPGLGDGTFAPEFLIPLMEAEPGPIAAGDLTGDGVADLVVGSTRSGGMGKPTLWIIPGGAAGLGPPAPLGATRGVVDLLIADLDGDGRKDIGAIDWGDVSIPEAQRLWLLHSQPGGAFGQTFLPAPGGPASIAAGDFNQDGRIDLATAEETLNVMDGGAAPAFSAVRRFRHAARSPRLVAHDVNRDGRPDLALTVPEGILVYLNGLTGNRPPVAIAEAPATAECDSSAGAQVILDGTFSNDPDSTGGTDGDIVSWSWFEVTPLVGEAPLGEGSSLSVTLPLGSHRIGLRVTDRGGAAAETYVEVTVVDTTPPALSVTSPVTLLWPPNHRMVQVAPSLQAVDACGAAGVAVTLVTSSEPDDAPGGHDGETTPDILMEGGALQLRAERDARGAGRTYTIHATATDGAGLTTAGSLDIHVPHDLGGSTDPVSLTVSETPAGTLVSWRWLSPREVPGAVSFDVVRGEIGGMRRTGSGLSLGKVACVEEGSSDLTTLGHEDAVRPSPGGIFFYLVESLDTLGRRSSWGEERAPVPREASEGGCPGATAATAR